MPFTIQRLDDEPIVIVTLRPPIVGRLPAELTSAVMKHTHDIDGDIYRITDFRGIDLTETLVQELMKLDINFTGLRVRSVVVGEGKMVNYLLDYANHNFLRAQHIIAFPCIEDALGQIRWEVKLNQPHQPQHRHDYSNNGHSANAHRNNGHDSSGYGRSTNQYDSTAHTTAV